VDEKKKFNALRFIVLTIFAAFSFVYIMANMGYYEYRNHNKRLMTDEQIEKFEEDVKKGVELDLNNYVVNDTSIIKNQLSLKVSKFIGNISQKLIRKIFKILNKIVET